MQQKSAATPADSLAAMRVILLGLLLFGLLGTGADLLLLDHTASAWEIAPLALIACSLIAIPWHVTRRTAISIRTIRFLMILFITAGFAGLWLHYRSNVEFKLETNPSLTGFSLLGAALRGKSPPALAPGGMIQLGLLGLAYCYRYPVSVSSSKFSAVTRGGK